MSGQFSQYVMMIHLTINHLYIINYGKMVIKHLKHVFRHINAADQSFQFSRYIFPALHCKTYT